MKSKKTLTQKEQEVMNKHWKVGKSPKQCTGHCNIFGIETAQCQSCGWDDGYIPVSSDPYNK